MVWTIIGLLLLFWVLGLIFNVVGGIIHFLLVIAVVVLIYKLVSGRIRKKA
ncbi:lmo0937 family membrane protein [Metabacillus idriensis]|uniref:lmo0937 family membrane protein n=1 Tax=Metabacillus idriensis TaxID=324768 RepID=UPI0017480564|nr:lmo0937 family membrane protein [Metabacillus idriensis]